MNWPLILQIFALGCGLAGFALVYWRDRKEEERKGKRLTLWAVALNLLVPIVLMIAATVENKQDNDLQDKRDADYTNLLYSVTGGDSYPMLQVWHQETNSFMWMIGNNSRYPLYDLTVRIDDRSGFARWNATNRSQPVLEPPSFSTQLNLGTRTRGLVQAFHISKLPQNSTEQYWWVLMTANNGVWVQKITATNEGGVWKVEYDPEIAHR